MAHSHNATGLYSHARMVDPPLWLPQRRAPRSASGRAKAAGLAYERATISAIRLAFAQTQIDFTDFFCNSKNATVALRSTAPSKSNIIQSNINENKQTQVGPPALLPNQWIEYQKNNIKHLCQPDLLIIFPPLDPIPSGNQQPCTNYNTPSKNDPTNHLLPRTNHLLPPSGNHLTPTTSGNPNLRADYHFQSSKNQDSGNFRGTPLPANHIDFIPQPSAAISAAVVVIVCEIKLTYTPSAIKKLNRLYLPLINHLYHPHLLLPLIICKNLTPTSPPHSFNLLSAISNPLPLIVCDRNFQI